LPAGSGCLPLRLLADAGKIEADDEVPCKIRDGADALEISLAENSVREPMHPADEFEAFRTLVDGGMSETDWRAALSRHKSSLSG